MPLVFGLKTQPDMMAVVNWIFLNPFGMAWVIKELDLFRSHDRLIVGWTFWYDDDGYVNSVLE